MSYIELVMCAMILYWLVLATILSLDACQRNAYIANTIYQNNNLHRDSETDTADISTVYAPDTPDGVSDASSDNDPVSRRDSYCTTSSSDLECDESVSEDMLSTGIHKRKRADVVDVNT
jgi:hypothetical protein